MQVPCPHLVASDTECSTGMHASYCNINTANHGAPLCKNNACSWLQMNVSFLTSERAQNLQRPCPQPRTSEYPPPQMTRLSQLTSAAAHCVQQKGLHLKIEPGKPSEATYIWHYVCVMTALPDTSAHISACTHEAVLTSHRLASGVQAAWCECYTKYIVGPLVRPDGRAVARSHLLHLWLLQWPCR